MAKLSENERAQIAAAEHLVVDAQFLIQDILAERGMTRVALARLAGISKARISQLLRPGANPTLRNLSRLFQVLGVEIAFTNMSATAITDAPFETKSLPASLCAERLGLNWLQYAQQQENTEPDEATTRAFRTLMDAVVTPGYETANDNLELTFAVGRHTAAM